MPERGVKITLRTSAGLSRSALRNVFGGRRTETRGAVAPGWQPRSLPGPREPTCSAARRPSSRKASAHPCRTTLLQTQQELRTGLAAAGPVPREGRLPGAWGRASRGSECPGLWGQPAAWGHGDCRVPATAPAPAQGEASPSACDREGPEAEAQLTHWPRGPQSPPATGSRSPLWPLLTSQEAQPVLGAHGLRQGGSRVIRSRQEAGGPHAGARGAQGLREEARPEGVLSRMMGRAGPPTRPGPQAWHPDLRGSARAVPHHSGTRGTGQAGRPRQRALLSLPVAGRSVGPAVWRNHWVPRGPAVM